MKGFDFKKRLGAGNFGEVWLVTDTGLNHDYALKLIPPNKVINQANFFQEAQVLKQVEHNNVIKVEDTGTMSDGRIYVKMEYLKKGSLEDKARGDYIHLSKAKKIMIDILRGLEYAHSKGVLHRDIKPGNILIGNSNQGILSDFGLALPDISTLDTSQLKQYHYVLHLAPEVNKLSDYTDLSDIYAAGITLYRLVNGDNYLPQLSPIDAKLQAQSGKFPDRTKYRNFVPRQLKTIINKAININPHKRFESAANFRKALEQLAIELNWDEIKVQNGMEWKASHNNYIYHLSLLTKNRKDYDLIMKKGRSNSAMRNITKFNKSNLDWKNGIREATKVLQSYVNGKEK